VPITAVTHTTAATPAPERVPTAPAVFARDWIDFRDSAEFWQLARSAAAATQRAHLDVQPTPPGEYQMPLAVLSLASQEETDEARAAAAPHRAHACNEDLLRSVWPCRQARLAASALAHAPPPPSPWTALVASVTPRLVVLCGPTFKEAWLHPVLLENACVLARASLLPDDSCAERGVCDTYAELWAAMDTKAPLIIFETSFTTRRARKQLLHRLRKQPAAGRYAWEALALDSDGPTTEEGWACVHPPVLPG
jgi:hypothetical protein